MQEKDDIGCTIKIRIPDMVFEAYEEYGVKFL